MKSIDNEECKVPGLGDKLETEDKGEKRIKDNFQVYSLKAKKV